MTHTIRTILAALCFSLLAVSCGKSAQTEHHTLGTAYTEGQEYADEMITTCGNDTTAMETYLLEFHTKYGEIKTADGEAAATDFRNGFSDRVREIAPETAQILFED